MTDNASSLSRCCAVLFRVQFTRLSIALHLTVLNLLDVNAFTRYDVSMLSLTVKMKDGLAE